MRSSQPTFLQTHILRIVAAVFWLLFALAFFGYQAWSQMSFLDMATQLLRFIHESWYGMLLLILIYGLRPLLFFPVSILRIIIGSLFGFWGGLPLVLCAEMVSASVAYVLGRFMGGDLIPLDGKGFLSTWKSRIRHNSFSSVFFLELTFLHFDVVHYFCGMMHVRYIPFLMGSTLGILPGLLGFLSFGASIEHLDTLDMSQITFKPEMLLVGILCIAVGILLSVYYHRRASRS